MKRNCSAVKGAKSAKKEKERDCSREQGIIRKKKTDEEEGIGSIQIDGRLASPSHRFLFPPLPLPDHRPLTRNPVL